jgi:hypothetical protein
MQQQQQQKLTETEELSAPNNTDTSQITEKRENTKKTGFFNLKNVQIKFDKW